MAIPDSPNWSALTDIKPYPVPSFPLPLAIPNLVQGTSLGGLFLNDSKGRVNQRWWVAYPANGEVMVRGSTGSVWGEEQLLFIEPTPIVNLALSFDQLGRAIVFYQTQNDLRLYWYDPIAQQNEVKIMSAGQCPIACFDFPQDTSQGFSDVILFYVKDNTIFMRVQRDRFDVEYNTGVTLPNVKLISCGLRVDNRLQVVYEYPTEELPTPVVQVFLP